MVITERISLDTKGNTDIIDITSGCQDLIDKTKLSDGIITVFNPGSTGGVTTIEYEDNLIRDIKNSLEIFAPSNKVYEHEKTWHDDNGSAHVRSAIVGPSITVPFENRELILGTWQQIVFCDFDTRPRKRNLIIQIIGE